MKINFVGDIGIFRKYEELNIDPFDLIQLPGADLNIGNFEFIISQSGKPFFYDVQEQYSCNYSYLNKININKFDGLGLANNHSLDYGLNGAKETIAGLKNQKIEVFGFSENNDYSIGEFTHGDIKLAIIACVKKGRWSKQNFGYGPDAYDVDEIVDKIKLLKLKFDAVIVFPHWGTELIEIPDFQDTIHAKKFIDAGADAVIGHHPHIPQGTEEYGNGLIAYSLGSFIYIHEEELGFSSRNGNRYYSICLNIEIGKEGILNYKPYLYKYNALKKIPEVCNESETQEYFDFLNKNIYNRKIYKRQIFRVLVRREIKSFWERFKKNPARTLIQYIKFINPRHIKKMIA